MQLAVALEIINLKGDKIEIDGITSPKTYGMALLRALVGRYEGVTLPNQWLAAIYGRSVRTIRRWRKHAGIVARAQFKTIPVTHASFDSIFLDDERHPESFLTDRTNKKYPAMRVIAAKLLAAGQKVMYHQQLPNKYYLSEARAAIDNDYQQQPEQPRRPVRQPEQPEQPRRPVRQPEQPEQPEQPRRPVRQPTAPDNGYQAQRPKYAHVWQYQLNSAVETLDSDNSTGDEKLAALHRALSIVCDRADDPRRTWSEGIKLTRSNRINGKLTENDESAAQRVYSKINESVRLYGRGDENRISLRTARALIRTYGNETVLTALDKTINRQRIQNPAGYLRTLLENG